MVDNDTKLLNSEQKLRREAILIGAVVAVVWWVVALLLYTYSPVVLVWHDQIHIFRPPELATPYGTGGFVHPVWVVVLTYPFRWLPLEMSTLVQALIYFIALALVIVKFGGNRRAILITLCSFISLDAVLQMNIDWLVILGMLLPAWASGPFVLAKPQIGLGYYFGLYPHDLLRAVLVMVIMGVVTLLIWGWWPSIILEKVGELSIGRFFNIAPLQYLSYLSIVIGIILAGFAFRRKDVPLGVLAGLFFTPYISAYSLPLMLGMLAIRWQRLALIITVVYWFLIIVIVGPLILQNIN